MNNQFSWELFNQMPVIGIMRNVSQALTESIAGVFYQSGFTCLELTMNSAGAEENIALLADKYQGRLNIGAGTVYTMSDLEKALKAGASYIVMPVINEEVISACVAGNISVFPGAYTPTEILKAWNLGAAMVKVFPATSLGTTYIKEVLGPLNHIKLAPTGGINFDNFISYFEAGAKAVGIGNHLFPKAVIEEENWEKLAEIYKAFTERYNEYHNQKAG